LQAEAEDHAKFVVTGIASAYLLRAMNINPLPAGFVIPAQPVKASKPPSGADWVHEIKHDGYRMIVRRDGPSVQVYYAARHAFRRYACGKQKEIERQSPAPPQNLHR
jgi:hypothetical protein